MRGKSVGFDDMPIEVWNCVGKKGIIWLPKQYLKKQKNPDEWRKLVSIYNQGNSEIAQIIFILSWLVIKWSLLENDRTKF